MNPSVIVWDLETEPDLGGFAAAHDLVGKSDVEVREAIGDKFPKHIYHSIICIERSSRTGRPITGRWTPLERPRSAQAITGWTKVLFCPLLSTASNAYGI
jgi:hypothetical protein